MEGKGDNTLNLFEKARESASDPNDYKHVWIVYVLVEENYNQIDNQLSNTSPGDDAAEKRKKGIIKDSAERKASDKRSSMKKRLLERQRQVAQQVPPKEQKTKRIEHEL